MIPCYQKRVNKEIQNFNIENNFNKYSNEIINFFRHCNLNIYYSTDDQNLYNKDLFLEIFDTNNKMLLFLSVPRDYPFKPYTIKYCNINFKNKSNSYFKNIYLLNEKTKVYDSNILSFFYKIQYCINPRFLNLNTNDCYCCNSITCTYNWRVSLTVENILLEYLELNYINFYNKPYTYLKILNIYNKLFEKYFNKLPNEIIEKIFSYILK